MNESHRLPLRFYFALPRLLAMLRGGDPRRGEQNSTEAWVVGIASYLVSYLFFAQLLPATFDTWLKVVLLAMLAFAVWLFWLLALYVNSLILKLLHSCGLLRSLPARRGQSVLVGTTTTAMAFALLQRGGAPREIGALWLTAVAMNLVAALILAFRHGESRRA
jgi:hypothetical protein